MGRRPKRGKGRVNFAKEGERKGRNDPLGYAKSHNISKDNCYGRDKKWVSIPSMTLRYAKREGEKMPKLSPGMK